MSPSHVCRVNKMVEWSNDWAVEKHSSSMSTNGMRLTAEARVLLGTQVHKEEGLVARGSESESAPLDMDSREGAEREGLDR